MYSPHKHSYLQSRTQNVNPRIINRCVDRARSLPTIDGCDLEPPFNRLTSEQPGIPVPNVDITRRPLGFGRWAMIRLRRELHDPDPSVVIQALMSISDLAHNPEKGYEAISLRIPDRLADLLAHPLATVRERACMALTVIAGAADGKSVITKNRTSLRNMAALLVDPNQVVRFKVSILIEMISRLWTAADNLVAAGYVQLLLKIVQREIQDIAIIYLEILRELMYGGGKDVAFKNGAFEIFVNLMERSNTVIRTKAAYCLMMITSTYCGKEMAYETSILKKLDVLLRHKDEDIHTSAASALMFCTVKSRSKIRAHEMMPQLPDRLVELCGHFNNPTCQRFCMKALANICEHPDVRKYVRQKYCEQLENVCIRNDEDLKRYKHTLLNVLNWVPWDETRYECHKQDQENAQDTKSKYCRISPDKHQEENPC